MYVPSVSGDVQTTCEPVPIIVPAVDAHVYVRESLFGSEAVHVTVDMLSGATVAGTAVRLPIAGGWFVTVTLTLLLSVPALPSDTEQVMVYVPSVSGDVQTTCELVPVIVPVSDAHV